MLTGQWATTPPQCPEQPPAGAAHSGHIALNLNYVLRDNVIFMVGEAKRKGKWMEKGLGRGVHADMGWLLTDPTVCPALVSVPEHHRDAHTTHLRTTQLHDVENKALPVPSEMQHK